MFGVSAVPCDARSVALLCVLPVLESLRLSYVYTAMPLQFLDAGWSLAVLGQLWMWTSLMRLPINALVAWAGDHVAQPIIVLITIGCIPMAVLPSSLYATLLSQLHLSVYLIQVWRSVGFARYKGVGGAAQRYITISEVMGYSCGTFVGGLLYQYGGWATCACYQLVLAAMEVGVVSFLGIGSLKCCSSKQTMVADARLDATSLAPTSSTAEVMENKVMEEKVMEEKAERSDVSTSASKPTPSLCHSVVLLPVCVVLAAHFVNLIVYTAEWTVRLQIPPPAGCNLCSWRVCTSCVHAPAAHRCTHSTFARCTTGEAQAQALHRWQVICSPPPFSSCASSYRPRKLSKATARLEACFQAARLHSRSSVSCSRPPHLGCVC